MKKLTRVLFCLLLLALSLAAAAMASAEDYGIWVNGEQFTSDKLEIACGSGKATLTPRALKTYPDTLTLTDAVITGHAIVDSVDCAVYSNRSLEIVVKGTNRIAANAGWSIGIVARDSLTLRGDGNLTIENAIQSSGISSRSLLYNIMEGDLTIRGGLYGILSEGMLEFSETGDVEITGCDTAVHFAKEGNNFTHSGSGNMTLNGTDYGIHFYQNNALILRGSGEVTVTGGKCGVYQRPGEDFYRFDIRLNGSETPVSFSTTNGAHAMEGGDVYRLPANYHADGAPNQKRVVYYREDPIVSVPYDVWVNGEQFVSDKMYIACGGGSAVLETPAAQGQPYTLTLTDAAITDCYCYIVNDIAVYSAYDLDVILKGKNTITLSPEYAFGFHSNGKITLKGDGDLTIVNGRSGAGIIANHDSLTIAMDGDLTIQGGQYGISATHAVDITGNGDLTITGCDTAVCLEALDLKFTSSGSGDLNINGTNYGIRFRLTGMESEAILAGSGEVNISGGKCGVAFSSPSRYAYGRFLLNGTETPITISTANGAKAVDGGIVLGENMDHYHCTGGPDTKQVVYYREDPIVSVPYDVWVNGEQFVSDKMYIACGGGSAVLEAPAALGQPYTLTLTNATISNFHKCAGNSVAVYSAYDLDVVVKGTNTIAVNAETAIGFYPEKRLTLKGDGDLTIENKKNAAGIVAFHDGVKIAMDGDLTIRDGFRGILTYYSLDITGKGDLRITGCATAVYFGLDSCFFRSYGSGNVSLSGKDYGVFFGGDSQLELMGSGEVSITGGKCGARFMLGHFGNDGKIRLDGIESPITISVTDGEKAIDNGDVVGSHRNDYQVIGSPNGKKVIYTYHPNLPKTGDSASPLLWTLLAAASCAAAILLSRKRSVRQ